MKTLLILSLFAALVTSFSGCMTEHSDTTPPPSKGQSGSSPGMSEHTSEGIHSTR